MFADDSLAKRLAAQTKKFYVDFAPVVRRAGIPGEPFLDLGNTAALFAGDGSPLTQAMGAFELDHLDALADFFRGRVSSWEAVLTPFSGHDALERLIARHGVPMGWESTLYRPLAESLPESQLAPEIEIIEVRGSERRAWAELSRNSFFGEDENEVALTLSRLTEDAHNIRAYQGFWDGKPAAAASLTLGLGVAALGGDATLPEFRGRGLQTALLQRRLLDASQEADVATMGALPGSSSQRNAERLGFRIAYSQLSLRMPATG